jgi:transcription initiation factor IIE alpha subunit
MQNRWADYGDARDSRIIELMIENATDQEIAEELGYTKATVGQLILRLRRRGVPLPQRKRGRRQAVA